MLKAHWFLPRFSRRPRPQPEARRRARQRPARPRPFLEPLEDRMLLSSNVLVNNVGAVRLRMEGFLALTDGDFEWAMQLNFYIALRATRAALSHMVEHGGGFGCRFGNPGLRIETLRQAQGRLWGTRFCRGVGRKRSHFVR